MTGLWEDRVKATNVAHTTMNTILGPAGVAPIGRVYDPFMDPSSMRPNPGAIETDTQRMAQLEMRMRMTAHELRQKLIGLDTTVGDGSVFMHFVRNGEMQVFIDEPSLFPSDALVNNLRLCL